MATDQKTIAAFRQWWDRHVDGKPELLTNGYLDAFAAGAEWMRGVIDGTISFPPEKDDDPNRPRL